MSLHPIHQPQNGMFRGHHEHTIDAKGRISLPARFRHALPAGDARLVVTRGLVDPCLDVYPMTAWERFEEKVAQLPKWDRDTVLLRRRYVSAAEECDLDKHGRLLVPQRLRGPAGLSSRVLWAGVGETMELWATDRWEASQELSDEELNRWSLAIGEKLDL